MRRCRIRSRTAPRSSAPISNVCAGLPPPAQRLLLVVMADDTGSLATVLRAAGTLDIDSTALDGAEEAGLVRASDGGVEFCHPLVRSTLYADATFAQRQAVHRALARRPRPRAGRGSPRLAPRRGVGRAGRCRRRRARADRAAGAAKERVRGRCRALERAAELSSDGETRGRRMVAAGQDWLAGRPAQALALLDRASGSVSDLAVRAVAEMHLRGTIELRCGVPAEAATILAAGAAEVAAVAPGKAIEMLIEAAQAASYAGDAAQIVEFGRRASALAGDDGPDQRFTVDAIVGVGSLLIGDAARAVPLLRQALALAEGFQDPRRLVHAGACAGYLEAPAPSSTVAPSRTPASGAGTALRLEFLARFGGSRRRYTSRRHAANSACAATEPQNTSATCSRRWR